MEPEPEPEPEPGPERRAQPRSGRAAYALIVAVVLAVMVVVALTTAGDDVRSPQAAPPASPGGPPIGSLPPLPVQVVLGPPKAAFVDLLHRADPVFLPYRDSQLESGGRAICRDYGRGIGVVEIASTILATSTLDSVQAITMIAAAGRTLCPAYDGGIASEVSGLG